MKRTITVPTWKYYLLWAVAITAIIDMLLGWLT